MNNEVDFFCSDYPLAVRKVRNLWLKNRKEKEALYFSEDLRNEKENQEKV